MGDRHLMAIIPYDTSDERPPLLKDGLLDLSLQVSLYFLQSFEILWCLRIVISGVVVVVVVVVAEAGVMAHSHVEQVDHFFFHGDDHSYKSEHSWSSSLATGQTGT